ncbi:MAG: phosphonate ABC transporter ATP-binding protein [Spirochaetales bacterium]|nr:phosphonate ABC transporter ATP-binding protein [Spirochaetales bacterium]
MLEIRELTKTYPTGDRALRGVDLTITRGQLVALIGPSGAGKSTLLRCVNRLVTPTSGSILMDSIDLATLSGAGLRRARTRIGMIFQEYALVERLTVLENVLSGKLGTMSLLRSLLRRYEGDDVRNALRLLREVGLEEQFEKRADALSGGQRQRVGIARALMQEPALLLVDEPTASLDPKTARHIMRLIKSACAERNLPAIVNLHDVQLAQTFADRIIGLKEGCIAFDGGPDELDEGRLTEIYGEEDWQATLRRMRFEADDEETEESSHRESIEARIDV